MLSVTIGILMGGFLISLFQHWVSSSQWANHSMKYGLSDPEDEGTMILWITVNYLLSDPHILEYWHLQQHSCEHLKSHTVYWVWMVADKLLSSAT